MSVAGICVACQCISEMLFFLLSSYLLQRLEANALLVIAISGFVVRAGIASLITEPWQLPFVQCLNGVSFSLFWCAGVDLCRQFAPSNMISTAMGFFAACYQVIGGISGNTSGMQLYEACGAQTMFSIKGLVMLGVVIVIAIILLGRKCSTQPEPGN